MGQNLAYQSSVEMRRILINIVGSLAFPSQSHGKTARCGGVPDAVSRDNEKINSLTSSVLEAVWIFQETHARLSYKLEHHFGEREDPTHYFVHYAPRRIPCPCISVSIVTSKDHAPFGFRAQERSIDWENPGWCCTIPSQNNGMGCSIRST